MLGLFHMGIAQATASPEWTLSEDEAKRLATATVPVLDMFGFDPDPRFVAVGGLIIVAGQIYVPRAVAIRVRKSAERSAKPRTSNVHSFTQSGTKSPSTNNGFANFGEPEQV